MGAFSFQQPLLLLLLLLIPGLVIWYWQKGHRSSPQMVFSTTSSLKSRGKGNYSRFVLFTLRTFTIILLILAFAKPRTSHTIEEQLPEKGIAIFLSVDVSESMQMQDLKPNRLTALKKIAAQFIQNRPHDYFGLVVFSGESFTQCPLTSDGQLVRNLLMEVEKDERLADGTAIGQGLASAVNRLIESKVESKVILLLTDGENNAGDIHPLKAAQLAQQFKIKVYTIGIGTHGMAEETYQDFMGNSRTRKVEVKIDEALLKEVAEKTGGQYFRATNNEDLADIYQAIDQLEKTEAPKRKYILYQELYVPLVLAALVFLLIEVILRYSIFKSFP